MTTQNLLVEVFVEELPPKALKKLGDAFAGVLFDQLKAQGVDTGKALEASLSKAIKTADSQAALDALEALISASSGNLLYVGTYNATAHTADYTAASGLADGVLVAASAATGKYVIVTTAGTGATSNARASPFGGCARCMAHASCRSGRATSVASRPKPMPPGRWSPASPVRPAASIPRPICIIWCDRQRFWVLC